MISLAWKNPRLLIWHSLIGMLLLAAAIVFWGGYTTELASWTCRWLPGCLVFQYTGIQCPGCGGTRAFLSCLRGDFLTALHWNPYWILAAAMILIEYIQIWIYAIHPNKMLKGWHRFHRYAVISFVVLTCLWVLLRNIVDLHPH